MAHWQKTLLAGLALIGPAYCGLMFRNSYAHMPISIRDHCSRFHSG